MGGHNKYCSHRPDNPAELKSIKITTAFYNHHFPQLVFFYRSESLFWCCVNIHENFLILMDVRMNFLLILLDAILAMCILRWQLANWSRIGLLFSHLKTFMYGASLFNFFLRIQTILAIICVKASIWDENTLFWNPLRPASMFFEQACKKITSKSGEGGATNSWSFFSLFPTNLWQGL